MKANSRAVPGATAPQLLTPPTSSATSKQSGPPVGRRHVSLPGPSSMSRRAVPTTRIDPGVVCRFKNPRPARNAPAPHSCFPRHSEKIRTFRSVCRPYDRGIVAVKRLILQRDLVHASLVGASANAIAQFVCPPKTKRLVFNFSSTRVNSCFEENMAPESNHPCPPSSFKANYEKGDFVATAEEKGEVPMDLKQPRIGKPPRHRMSSSQLSSAVELELEIGVVTVEPSSDEHPPFVPVFRSGSCSNIGRKPSMEDEHVCIDNLPEHLGAAAEFPRPGAFYGVFDGHGGTDAASYVRENILRFIVEDTHFPVYLKKAMKSAFLKADSAFANAASLDSSSGTTVLTALICGRTLLIANAGDCRAVLGKRGKAIELSKDHKPDSPSERLRIEELGGVVYDGYLNGDLSVARAIGDWHMKCPEGSSCPLTAEPELQEMVLCEEDEFLILGCDGLWDVMSSQRAVTIARKELMIHNDPERCSRELVREALNRNTRDNLTVVVVCFSSDPPPQLKMPKLKRSISIEGLYLLQDALDTST